MSRLKEFLSWIEKLNRVEQLYYVIEYLDKKLVDLEETINSTKSEDISDFLCDEYHSVYLEKLDLEIELKNIELEGLEIQKKWSLED